MYLHFKANHQRMFLLLPWDLKRESIHKRAENLQQIQLQQLWNNYLSAALFMKHFLFLILKHNFQQRRFFFLKYVSTKSFLFELISATNMHASDPSLWLFKDDSWLTGQLDYEVTVCIQHKGMMMSVAFECISYWDPIFG